MKLIKPIFGILLTIIIAFVSIALAANMLIRLPDAYAYEFTSSQITKSMNLEAKPKDLAELISGYLMGNIDEFQLTSEYQGREQLIFSMKDQVEMNRIKSLTNLLLIEAVLCILIGSLITAGLIRRREKERVRDAYKHALGVYLFLWLMILSATHNEIFGPYIMKLVFVDGFDTESTLGLLLSANLLTTFITFIFIASAVILFLLGNLIWKLTKERRMFLY